MTLTVKSAHHKDVRTGYASMEHRHFATIAAIIRDAPWPTEREIMAVHFADRLRRTNPRFDHERFLAACLGDAE